MNTMTDDKLAPIVKTITVERDAEAAFRFFTDGFDQWWPKETHSIGADRHGVTPERVAIEPGVGGRIFETAADGTEHNWGRIRVWEPGRRLVFSWGFDKPEDQHTEVAVTFTAIGDNRTRLDLSHHDWEKDPKGAELQPNYNRGWEPVMASLLRQCNAHA